jgi:hypothetical protein
VELRVVCPVCGLLLYSVEQTIRSAIKIHLLHLVGILFPSIYISLLLATCSAFVKGYRQAFEKNTVSVGWVVLKLSLFVKF